MQPRLMGILLLGSFNRALSGSARPQATERMLPLCPLVPLDKGRQRVPIRRELCRRRGKHRSVHAGASNCGISSISRWRPTKLVRMIGMFAGRTAVDSGKATR